MHLASRVNPYLRRPRSACCLSGRNGRFHLPWNTLTRALPERTPSFPLRMLHTRALTNDDAPSAKTFPHLALLSSFPAHSFHKVIHPCKFVRRTESSRDFLVRLSRILYFYFPLTISRHLISILNLTHGPQGPLSTISAYLQETASLPGRHRIYLAYSLLSPHLYSSIN